MLTEEEFIEQYERTGYFPGGQYTKPNAKYNDRQLRSKYQSYVKSQEKKQDRRQAQIEKQQEKFTQIVENGFEDLKDHAWIQMREDVYRRDNYRCQLYAVLTPEEKKQFGNSFGYHWLRILNPAHIFKVGSNPSIKYKPEYVVTMNQISHSMLDQNNCPLTGRQINKEDVEWWWKRIIGENQYEKLKGALK